MELSRCDFIKLGVASAVIGALAIGGDKLLNEREREESERGEREEPPP